MAVTKEMLPLGLAEWKNRAINLEILTAEKATEWETTIKNWPESDTAFFYAFATQAFVLAWKKK